MFRVAVLSLLFVAALAGAADARTRTVTTTYVNKPEWEICSRDSDCGLVPVGCDQAMPANRAMIPDVKRYLEETVDEAVREAWDICSATNDSVQGLEAVCRQNKCEARHVELKPVTPPEGASSDKDMAKTIYAATPPQWRVCARDRDCIVIGFGCSGAVSVNSNYKSDAQRPVWNVGGDPRTMNCFQAGPRYSPACVDKQCVAFTDLE